MTFDQSPAGLTTLFADIGRDLHAYGTTADAVSAVAQIAVKRVPGSEWASITQGVNGAFRTIASTHPEAAAVDGIQYGLGTGPCVDAIRAVTVFRTGDLGSDSRWSEFGRRAVATADVHSMLSFRLLIEYDDMIAGLNLYATERHAFDDAAQVVGTLLATHAGMAISAAAARERADHLQRALAASRDIGVAMGVLMGEHKISRDQAFDLLRIISQHANRKLADIAVEVGDTGTLSLPTGTPLRGSRRPRPGAR